jgi:hypothetical protein
MTKLKTKKQHIIIKPVRGSSPNKALSIHSTTSPSQSRETVPLTRVCVDGQLFEKEKTIRFLKFLIC